MEKSDDNNYPWTVKFELKKIIEEKNEFLEECSRNMWQKKFV